MRIFATAPTRTCWGPPTPRPARGHQGTVATSSHQLPPLSPTWLGPSHRRHPYMTPQAPRRSPPQSVLGPGGRDSPAASSSASNTLRHLPSSPGIATGTPIPVQRWLGQRRRGSRQAPRAGMPRAPPQLPEDACAPRGGAQCRGGGAAGPQAAARATGRREEVSSAGRGSWAGPVLRCLSSQGSRAQPPTDTH